MGQVIRINSVAKFDHCYGCGVCAAACSKNAITMKLNSDGFYQPVIERTKCVNCSACLNICAFENKFSHIGFRLPLKSMAGWSTNQRVRDFCTSGGVVYELCSEYINRGYQICAVRYNYELKQTEHFLFSSVSDLMIATGSKYLQSYSIKALLDLDWKHGKYLVIGTPCMISSLRRLVNLHQAQERFLLVDFFCHGVPSYLMWEKYEEYVNSQVGKILSISWRNKDNGWQDSTCIKARGDNGRFLSFLSKGDLFFEFFLKDRCLNTCCYDDCIFKQTNSNADIRVGDLWSPNPKYYNNRLGVNAIMVFSQAGLNAINLNSGIYYEEEELSSVLGNQMSNNPKRSITYKRVMKDLKTDKSLKDISKTANRLEYINGFLKPDFLIRAIKRLVSSYR